ncbi:response regulator [Thiocapsa roseopersicina]|uniref:Two component transcriptional regulator, LuxR family n=1 Tax=Thiocapsa roseopersicina TaxID=1058 RepID=A0A1H2ZAI2_THIRO|nr:response regulator transcription factor [Thiocapsa roseopersicina]SDX13854.1 two component transcriptional regulator, LuxR family [Thiocapsa roseopersicina]
MSRSPATLLIADDHDLLRDMLARRLAEEPDLQVIGTVADASAALDACLAHRPDLVLMDIDMPGLSAFKAAHLMRDRLPDTRILFLSAYVHDGFISQALEVRAGGYLTKGRNPEALITCIRTVIRGGTCFAPEVESRLEIGPGGVRLAQKPRSRLELLTAREKQILSYLARGMSKKEIARLDGTSVKTVDHHCQHVMEKLDLHDRVELTRYAIREGLVAP